METADELIWIIDFTKFFTPKYFIGKYRNNFRHKKVLFINLLIMLLYLIYILTKKTDLSIFSSIFITVLLVTATILVLLWLTLRIYIPLWKLKIVTFKLGNYGLSINNIVYPWNNFKFYITSHDLHKSIVEATASLNIIPSSTYSITEPISMYIHLTEDKYGLNEKLLCFTDELTYHKAIKIISVYLPSKT